MKRRKSMEDVYKRQVLISLKYLLVEEEGQEAVYAEEEKENECHSLL